MNMLLLHSMLLCVDVGNVLLHGLGVYLLSCLRKKQPENTQTFYIFNLAVSELVFNFFIIVRELDGIMKFTDRNEQKIIIECIYIIGNGARFSYLHAMFFLTGDRLAHSIFPFQYRQKWNVYKTKVLLIVTWAASTIISIAIVVLRLMAKSFYRNVLYSLMYWYFPIAVNILYCVFATTAYVVIFVTYVKSRQRALRTPSTSYFRLFVTSNFFLSAMIVGSFCILTIIPELVTFTITLSKIPIPVGLFPSYYISTSISYTCDGVIYIYLQKSVKKILDQKLRCLRRMFSNSGPTRDASMEMQRLNKKSQNGATDTVIEEVDSR